jgi:hypothetical protein
MRSTNVWDMTTSCISISTHFEREDFWEAAGLQADDECDDKIAIDVARERNDDADDDDDDAREDGGLGEWIAPQLMTQSACILNFPQEGLLGV